MAPAQPAELFCFACKQPWWLGSTPPRLGRITLCMTCGEAGRFDGERVVPLTKQEFDERADAIAYARYICVRRFGRFQPTEN